MGVRQVFMYYPNVLYLFYDIEKKNNNKLNSKLLFYLLLTINDFSNRFEKTLSRSLEGELGINLK